MSGFLVGTVSSGTDEWGTWALSRIDCDSHTSLSAHIEAFAESYGRRADVLTCFGPRRDCYRWVWSDGGQSDMVIAKRIH